MKIPTFCLTGMAAMLLLVPQGAKAQEKTFLFIAPETTLSENDTIALRTVIKGELERQGFLVTEDPGVPRVLPDQETIIALAEKAGIKRVFSTSGVNVGMRVIVTFSERPVGTGLAATPITRQIALGSIEEITFAGPRIVQSVLKRERITATADMSTLTGEEARQYKKKYGEAFWGAAVQVGAQFNSSGLGTGFSINGGYEMDKWRLDIIFLRLLWDSDDDDKDWVQGDWVSVGATYLPSMKEVTPTFGLGISISTVWHEWTETDDEGDDTANDTKTGIQVHFTGGIEAFRYHKARLWVGGRLSLPLFSLDDGRPVGIGMEVAVMF